MGRCGEGARALWCPRPRRVHISSNSEERTQRGSLLAPAPLRLSRAPSAPGTAAKAAEPAKTDPEKAYSPRPWKWRLQRPGPQAPATSALAAVISACFVQRHFQMHPGQPAMLLHIHPQTAQRR